MNRILIGIFLTAYALSGYAKDLTFNCEGKLNDYYLFPSEFFEIKDIVGLILRDKTLVVVGSKNFETPTMYGGKNKTYLNNDFTFPICSSKNYEIISNNYSCDISKIRNYEKSLLVKSADTFNIKFNGISKILTIETSPSFEKLLQLTKNKTSYKKQNATYQCDVAVPSF